jgi:hypothetical protein
MPKKMILIFIKFLEKQKKSSPSYFEKQPNFSLPYHPRKNP